MFECVCGDDDVGIVIVAIDILKIEQYWQMAQLTETIEFEKQWSTPSKMNSITIGNEYDFCCSHLSIDINIFIDSEFCLFFFWVFSHFLDVWEADRIFHEISMILELRTISMFLKVKYFIVVNNFACCLCL